MGMETNEQLDRIEDNQLKLMLSSAVHGEKLESIDKRLANLNGTVARHEARMVAAETFTATHPLTCSAMAKLDRIEAGMTIDRKTDAATHAERQRWHKRLHPGYVLAGLFFVLLVLRNVDLIPQALKLIIGNH